MDRFFLELALWAAMLGFTTFCVIYTFWVKPPPWKDPIGRHVLFFMGGLAFALLYGIVNRYVADAWRLWGWALVLSIVAFMVWWRVAILIKYDRETAQLTESDR